MLLATGEWIEETVDTKLRKVYTSDQLKVNGINMFGMHKIRKSCAQLSTHFHRNAIEFTHVMNGNLTFDVSNGEIYNLFGGDILILPANTLHSTNNLPMPVHNMFWFQLKIDSQQILNLNEKVSKNIIQRFSKQFPIKFKCKDNTITEMFQKAYKLLPIKTEIDREKFALHITNILYNTLDNINKDYNPISKKILHTIEYIEANVIDKIQLQDLAKIAIMSESCFKQKFCKEVGIAPREYINLTKINFAKNMLKNNTNITDIAFDLNFSSSNYFCVVFKKFTNYTPSEYKKVHNDY